MMEATPLGMNFGEFLLQGDLEFLNQISSAQRTQVMGKMNKEAQTGASLLP